MGDVLTLVKDGEPEGPPVLTHAWDLIRARIESGEVTGFYIVLETRTTREPMMVGDVDPDAMAGFTLRVMASWEPV